MVLSILTRTNLDKSVRTNPRFEVAQFGDERFVRKVISDESVIHKYEIVPQRVILGKLHV